jgi:hypothetical protein
MRIHINHGYTYLDPALRYRFGNCVLIQASEVIVVWADRQGGPGQELAYRFMLVAPESCPVCWALWPCGQ